MAAGLQVLGPSAEIVVDLSDKVTRVLGTVTTGTTNGSIVDPNLALGDPFFTIAIANGDRVDFANPVITISGTTLGWSFPPDSTVTPQSVVVIYGVFA